MTKKTELRLRKNCFNFRRKQEKKVPRGINLIDEEIMDISQDEKRGEEDGDSDHRWDRGLRSLYAN